MAILELRQDSIRSIPETTFLEAGIAERGDLQRLLRDRIEIISEDTLDADSFAARYRKQHSRKFDAQRFYCAADQLVYFGHKTYAFVSNWGSRLPTAIANITEAFADKGISCSKPRHSGTGAG